MTWKDLWTEFLLKMGVKINLKPKRLIIHRHDIEEFMVNAQVVKGRTERDFEDRLFRRTTISSYLRTDDRLFEPYVDMVAQTTIGRENFSFAREIGNLILNLTNKYETDNNIHVNKSFLYFGLSLNSIYLNDTINAMIYWELSQEEESNTFGAAFDPTIAINNTIDRYSSVINPIKYSLKQNDLYNGLLSNYNFIPDFTDILRGQHTPELFAYFSSGLRYKQVDYWIKNNFTAMTKIYSQELINSLCILCEANLKNIPSVTNNMIGPILINDIPTINPSVASHIGGNNPASGLFSLYPSKTEADFNTSFPALINVVKTNSLNVDNLKAHLIYGAYMLRNKTLHDFNPNLVFYNNKHLFADTIGLLFASVCAIKSL